MKCRDEDRIELLIIFPVLMNKKNGEQNEICGQFVLRNSLGVSIPVMGRIDRFLIQITVNTTENYEASGENWRMPIFLFKRCNLIR